jgi:hypothetical protein
LTHVEAVICVVLAILCAGRPVERRDGGFADV